MNLSLQPRARTCLLILVLLSAPHAAAQVKPLPPPPACDQTRALLLVQQQATEAKSFTDPVGQINVMLRAADLLWPYQPDGARKIFTDAFNRAVAHYKQRGDETRTEGHALGHGLTIQLPDQRFKVVSAIARRDADWARRLAAELADEARQQAAQPDAAAQRPGSEVGDKLIMLADSMLTVDRATALAVVRGSFQQPVSFLLPRFLYKLTALDPAAAEQLYKEALGAYTGGTIEDLLYLSVYPFALRRPVGPTRIWLTYELPVNFVGNVELQRLYLAALLRQADVKLGAQAQPVAANAHRSDPELLLTALSVLEPLIAQYHPAFNERAAVLKATAQALLAPTTQRSVDAYAAPYWQESTAPDEDSQDSFARSVEQAERQPDPARRDQFLSMAVTDASPKVTLAELENAVQKISDAGTRRELLNAMYFTRTQKAIKDGLFDDATRLMAKVDALGERALLALELADASIKQLADSQRARESLEAALQVAQAAPHTNEKARALLGVASLYAKFDSQRAFEVLGEAVKAINQVSAPVLDDPVLNRRIEGKTFGYYTSNPAPAFTLESAFRELGPYDFEGALAQARGLTEQVLRATAISALSAKCLAQPRASEPQKKVEPGGKERPEQKKASPQAKPPAQARARTQADRRPAEG